MQIRVEGVPVTVDDSFKNLSPAEQDKTVDEIAASEDFKKAPREAPETTAGDVGRGVASGATTGAVNIVPGVGALVADIATAPGVALYKGIDLAAGLAGYDTGLAERYKPGGFFGHSAKSAEASQALVDRYLIDPPVSKGGRVARAVTSAGVEALGGSGLFRVAATGQIFSNADDAARAAETAIRTAPGQSSRAALALKEAGEAPAAQAAYSAAAGGGGEIAEQQGLPPIVGSVAGMAAAAAGHAAVPLARQGAQAVTRNIDESFQFSKDAKERAATAGLREKAEDPEALQAWAVRAQEAEDAFAAEKAKGGAADAARLESLDAARREAHGELVPGSRPTLYEAAGEDIGIGSEQRRMRQGDAGGYRAAAEQRRTEQNQARYDELKRLGGEGTPEEILTEFRRLRDDIDTRTAAYERAAQDEAAKAAQRAGTTASAEAVGEGVRGPLVAAQKAAKAEGGRLYDAVAAEGVTVGTGRLKAAVARHFKDIPESPLSADEKHFAGLIKGYGGQLDFDLLQKLRSEIASRSRDFQRLPDVVRRRFTLLKNAIDEAMDDGLARAIADDPNLFQRVAGATGEAAPGAPLGMRGRRGAERPKPQMPLSEFIARHGGLPLDAESAARDWGSVRVKGRLLAHPGGRGIDDYWRETLMEEGYIPYDVGPGGELGTARNVDDEIRRLLEDELHGGARPDLGAQRPLDGPEREMADARALIADRIKREGIDNPSPAALDEAARMMVEGEEKHPTTAYERAVTQGEPPAPGPAAAEVPFEGGGRVEPPVDSSLTEAQRAANRHWREMKQTYGAQPVGAITKQAPTESGFKMTEAGVAEAVLQSGPKGAEAMRALKRAGASDAALTEAAALSFSDPRRGVMRDGVVDPKGFRRWLNNYGPALDELPPEVRQRFQSASDAARTFADVLERRKSRLHEFDRSAVGKVLGIPAENLQKAIGAYLENPAKAAELARRVAGNADAKAGLQRLVADHILNRFSDASDVLSKNALTNWLVENRDQVAAIFGGENAKRFERLVGDVERGRRELTVGKDPAGPGTAGDLASMGKAATGATVGAFIGKMFGPKGMAVYGATKVLASNLRAAGLNSVDEVLARALLDPEFARKLLTKAPALKNEKFLKGLGTTILRSSLAGAAYGGNR